MTQEQKELLLKDLCARLPYEIKISVNNKIETLQGISIPDNVVLYDSFLSSDIEEVKPYLFPMSSMTDEQYREIEFLAFSKRYSEIVDIYNRNHIDYRGLIPMGLAINATGLNIY